MTSCALSRLGCREWIDIRTLRAPQIEDIKRQDPFDNKDFSPVMPPVEIRIWIYRPIL